MRPFYSMLLIGALALFCPIENTQAQKTIEATRISDPISIDGILDEDLWGQSAIASDFITWQPNPGLAGTFPTEVRILYDDDALYLGAVMKVSNPDSIATELTQRDDIGNTDWFGVVIDTYGNGTDAFEFVLFKIAFVAISVGIIHATFSFAELFFPLTDITGTIREIENPITV